MGIDPAAVLAVAVVACAVIAWGIRSLWRHLINRRRQGAMRLEVKRGVSSVPAGARAVVGQPAVVPIPTTSNPQPPSPAGIDAWQTMVSFVAGARTIASTTIAALRRRWQRFKRARARREVIQRVWDGMSDYLDGLLESEPAVRQPVALGLAAAWTYRWNQAIEYFQVAKTRASEAQAVPLLNQIGMCHRIQGRPNDALKVFRESARIAERLGNGQGRAAALCNIGVIRHDYGELNPALEQMRKGLDAARNSGDERAARVCLANIGNIQHDKGRLADALKSHLETLEMAEQIGDGPGVVDSLANIASVFRDRDELDQAFEHYTKALDSAIQIRYELGMAVALSGLAGVHSDRGEIDRALELHEEALTTSRRIGHRLGIATELGSIGLIRVKKGMHEQAVPYLAESHTLFQIIGVATGPSQALTGLAKCDDALGRKRVRLLLKQALPSDDLIADLFERIDRLPRRRHRRKKARSVRRPATTTGR